MSSFVLSFQVLSQRRCQLNSLFQASPRPLYTSPLVSFTLPLRNEHGNNKAIERFPQTKLPVVHFHWSPSPQSSGGTSTPGCSVALVDVSKEQKGHGMSCTGRITGDAYILKPKLIPDTKVDCAKHRVSHTKHRGTAAEHHVYWKEPLEVNLSNLLKKQVLQEQAS